MKVNKSSRGFTLIELLVVLAISGVLIAMLLPTIAGVRAQAKSSSCANHERQIFVSMVSFAAEHDGGLPVPATCNETAAGNGPNVAWAMDAANGGMGVLDFQTGTLWPYMPPSVSGRQEAVLCPADNVEVSIHAGIHIYNRNFSYSFNANIGHPSGQVSIKLIQVVHPTQKILIYEENAPNDQWGLGGTNTDDLPSGRHGTVGANRQGIGNLEWMNAGRGNHCFFDGHVESKSPSNIENDRSTYYPLLF